ncbi:MAG: glycosyl hydrolase-related protein [Gemmatimonadaceae bacterium]
MTLHVVTHTHWDREWYHPAERFRQRLVPLVDELLDPVGDSRSSFLLDGQTVVLEDYLDVRPDRASEVAAALREQRLEAGPWFVLADGLIPGGEGLVRNLLAGRRTLQALRATPPPVLYCPDSFGHPAALPTLARGFDTAVVVLWRGYGGANAPDGDTAWWSAPAGDRVVLFHLTPSGYELAANLPSEPQAARARWARMRGELAGRATTGAALLLNGADHHARQPDLAGALAALRDAAAPDEVRASSLAEFARDLVRRSSDAPLPQLRGELRDSYGYTWTLQGTLASRAGQKRRYALRERELVRDVEPWAAIARFNGGASRRQLMNAAWRPVLLCQAHDTLCGTGVDPVARAMDARLESAAVQAAGLREDAILDLIGHDRDAARAPGERWRSILLLRNRAPRARSGVADVSLALKLADVPVGPGSSHVSLSAARAAGFLATRWPFGEPVQILDMAVVNELTEAPRFYPDNDAVVRFDAVAWVDHAEPYGVTAFEYPEHPRPEQTVPYPVVARGRSVSNGRISLRWDAAGRLTFEHLAAGRVIRSLLDWESRRDGGDLYTPSIRGRKLAPRLLGTRVLHPGPLRGVVEQRWRFAAKGERVDVAVRFLIDADGAHLRMHVVGENAARDHRLRLRVRTDVRDGITVADAAFGPVERAPAHGPDARMERRVHTAPLHRYVSQFAEQSGGGATLFADGLAEYESLKDGFAVTLLRAVGELSRSNLVERPGHAGWPAPTPDAQCQGPFECHLALLLHGARSSAVIDEIERVADDVLHPLVGETLRSALRVPGPVHGMALEGEGLALSAVKESEDGEWLVLRCVNLVNEEREGTWRVGRIAEDAQLARLDETPLEPLAVRGDAIAFRAPPRGVVTILVR